MLDSSNNVHTFHPAIGLTLLKAAHSEPMVAALVCVADNMGVLVKVIKMVSKLFVKHCGPHQAFDPGCGCKDGSPVA